MKYILAGNYDQYINYLKNNKLAPREAKYMGTSESWYGERIDKIILTGTWWVFNSWFNSYKNIVKPYVSST